MPTRHPRADVQQRAQELAISAHIGQVDKSGQPYIGHPARVSAGAAALAAARHPQDANLIVDAAVVGWLHDVVEDTPVTLEHIAAEFGQVIAAAVDALTRRTGEASSAYYGRVAADPLARLVKEADLKDNTTPSRLAALDPDTRTRLKHKYAHARRVLGIPDPGATAQSDPDRDQPQPQPETTTQNPLATE